MPPALRTLLRGKPEDYRVHGANRATLAAMIEAVVRSACRDRQLQPPTTVCIPSAEFTNRTIRCASGKFECVGTVRFANEPADGVLLDGTRKAGAITLADCLGICLSEESRLAVLHGGLKCLLRDDRENIIVKAVQEHAFHPEKTHAWIGAGIGPCCYGLDTVPEGVPRDAVLKPTRGPRQRKPYAADLRAIVKSQLLALGVPEEQITIDERCTSCFENKGTAPYWSHVRGDRARNLLVAWLG